MATPKKKVATKSTAPKTTTRKAATTAKTAVRKAPAKSAAKTTPKKSKTVARSAFQPTAEKVPFFTYRFTMQSVYWLVLSVLVLVLGAWVMYLDAKIQSIYDQVEINTALNDSYIVPTIEKVHPEAAKPPTKQ